MNYIAFPISDALKIEADQVMENLRLQPSDSACRRSFVAIINRLADYGIDFFFVDSIRHAGLSNFIVKGAKIGLQGFKAALQPLLRRIVSSMDDEQIIRVLDFMEDVFVSDE